MSTPDSVSTPRRGLLAAAAASTAGLVALGSTQRAHADPGGSSPWATASLGTSVKERPYRAKGDGRQDDTAAVQRAVDDVVAAGGGAVIFPAGTYAVSKPITITKPLTGKGPTDLNVHLLGEGPASHIVRSDPSKKHTLLSFGGPREEGPGYNRGSLRNLAIGLPEEKNYPPDQWPHDGDPAVLLKGLVEFSIENCYILQGGGPGLELYNSYIGNLIGNVIQHTSDAVVLRGVANAIRFIGNRIQANSGVGIRFPEDESTPRYKGSRAVTVYIAGNDIEGNGAQGILFTDARYDEITIIGNHFERNWLPKFTSKSGPYIEKTATGTEFDDVVVIGNRAASVPGAFVFAEGTNLSLIGNTLDSYRLGEGVAHWFAGPLPDGSLEMDGDVRVNAATAGLVLTSPDGARHRLTVNDDGTVASVPAESSQTPSAKAVKTAVDQETILHSFDFDRGPWAGAGRIDDFFVMNTTDGVPPVQTKAYLLWDDKALYVGYQNLDPGLPDIPIERYVANSVQTFVKTGSSSMKGFFTNPVGKKFSYVQEPGTRPQPAQAAWATTAKMGERSWNVVQAIPFATVGIDPTQTSSVMALLFRNYNEHDSFIGWDGGAPWKMADLRRVELVPH